MLIVTIVYIDQKKNGGTLLLFVVIMIFSYYRRDLLLFLEMEIIYIILSTHRVVIIYTKSTHTHTYIYIFNVVQLIHIHHIYIVDMLPDITIVVIVGVDFYFATKIIFHNHI